MSLPVTRSAGRVETVVLEARRTAVEVRMSVVEAGVDDSDRRVRVAFVAQRARAKVSSPHRPHAPGARGFIEQRDDSARGGHEMQCRAELVTQRDQTGARQGAAPTVTDCDEHVTHSATMTRERGKL